MEKVIKPAVSSPNHKPNGCFAKGNNANPNGANQFTSIIPLIDALKRMGAKKSQSFWDMVAAKCWTSDPILIAVLKKVLPDKIKGEGFGDTKIVIVRSERESENTIKILPRPLSNV